jgi:3'-phosphoadenosine 5'-phosphosulfate sulfotransferase (PAPS reductase)/FAD synthetase
MKTFLSWSGGKDSSASIAICHEQGIHLDGIITAEVMFSHSLNISAEHPEHTKWLHEVAIPKIENDFGYPVTVIKSKEDYISLFNRRVYRTKNPERIGKKRGFVLGHNACYLKRDCKIIELNKWSKQQGEYINILGIAADETKRLESMHSQNPNNRSVLEEFNIVEADTYDICRKYDLLSPFYTSGRKRQGCWFCPNCGLEELAEIKYNYPQLWEQLRLLDMDPEKISYAFKYNKTFAEIDAAI